ncbi:hypothetical protein B0H17DRAFT_1151676, partial [Mycena rosella]
MATETGAGSKHTPADREYLDSLSARLLMEFRNYVFSPTYIALNAAKFLDHEWVDRELLPEPRVASVPRASANVKMRALHEGGREVFELLSASEPEADDSDLEVLEALQHTSRSSSTIPLPDPKQFLDDNSDSAEPDARSESSDEENGSDLIKSDTVWLDDGTSLARIGPFRPTRKMTVARMEYRQGPAAIYPILRTPTGIVVDLSDQMYWFRDPTTKELYTLNTIIMNADNDSWDWSGGGINQTAIVTFAPGEKAVECRRIRYKCVGAHACDRLDKALRSVIRFELDSAPRDAIIAAQQETRRREGNSPEERTVLFIKIVRNAKCDAVDSSGNKCRGGPIMKPKPQASRGHQYFVGCSGWTTKFRQGHRTHSIPDNVDENIVANALAGLPLSDDPTHAHIVNGMQVQGQIQNYPCPATRSIYVPKDLSVRKVLIVHNDTGHNHPMPALTKLSFGLKDTYRGCIKSYGVLGATVAKIDNDPVRICSPLHNKRVKRDILHAEKIEKYPNGLGIDAIRLMYHAEKLTKPLPERYIHSYIETNKGEIIILTFVPYLLKLLDDPGVTSFDGDTTYKGIESKLNEWELSLFAKVVQRDFFEILFDELQRIKREVTGKPLPFKRFVPDGNLLVTNVDMDAAQVMGLCRSALKFSDPEYSGIPRDTPPEQLAPEFIKNFVYIDSKGSLDAFSSFVYGLGVKKIADWWRHKVQHSWIIPCLIKSQSKLPANVWDATPSTTNTNEAQHHWTNSLTGIKLTPVEALE